VRKLGGIDVRFARRLDREPAELEPALLERRSQLLAHKLLWDADALLLERKTFEAFAQAWPPRAGADDYTDRINARRSPDGTLPSSPS
jgi:hypothetical protein